MIRCTYLLQSVFPAAIVIHTKSCCNSNNNERDAITNDIESVNKGENDQ